MGNQKNRYAKGKKPAHKFNPTDTDLGNNDNFAMAREQIKAQSEAVARAAELDKKRAELLKRADDIEKAAKHRSAVLDVASKLKIEAIKQQLLDERLHVAADLLKEEDAVRGDLKNKEYTGKFVRDLFVKASENAENIRKTAPVAQAESIARDTLLNQQMLSRQALLDREAKERLPSFFGTRKPAQSTGTQTREMLNGRLVTRKGQAISANVPDQFVSTNKSRNDKQTMFGAKPATQQPSQPKTPTSPKSGMWQMVPSPKREDATKKPAAAPAEAEQKGWFSWRPW